MAKYLILYLACVLVFFPLDFIWLSTMGKSFYFRELDGLLLDQPNLVIAGLFYLAYVAGIVILVAAPAEGDVLKALLMGAVLGLVAYGTYDLTNLSTVKGFSPLVAAVDMAWGTALTAVSAAGGVWIARFFA
ncbi:MAG: DUF2177 family protein [Devosia sp.]|uniref:DUF2177 family protein n=1 Tax=Devosia sp. TaxID=1871048 RepID=UPI0024CA36D9|nr:DUF2177 family protein [Devosia sp.]UYO00997.1 MAG: DUF2177 family protein [Devosia sp.]